MKFLVYILYYLCKIQNKIKIMKFRIKRIQYTYVDKDKFEEMKMAHFLSYDDLQTTYKYIPQYKNSWIQGWKNFTEKFMHDELGNSKFANYDNKPIVCKSYDDAEMWIRQYALSHTKPKEKVDYFKVKVSKIINGNRVEIS